jgi:hypothetical protein
MDRIITDAKGNRYRLAQEKTISKLYMDQSLKLRLDQELTIVKTGRGVRHGCYLSPIVFDLLQRIPYQLLKGLETSKEE